MTITNKNLLLAAFIITILLLICILTNERLLEALLDYIIFTLNFIETEAPHTV